MPQATATQREEGDRQMCCHLQPAGCHRGEQAERSPLINPTIVILNNATLQYVHSCYHTAKAFQESHLLLQQVAAMFREDQARHSKASPNHTGMREAEAVCQQVAAQTPPRGTPSCPLLQWAASRAWLALPSQWRPKAGLVSINTSKA